jgi:hypothetical protein
MVETVNPVTDNQFASVPQAACGQDGPLPRIGEGDFSVLGAVAHLLRSRLPGEVFNVPGQKVAALAEGRFDADVHRVVWDTDGLISPRPLRRRDRTYHPTGRLFLSLGSPVKPENDRKGLGKDNKRTGE